MIVVGVAHPTRDIAALEGKTEDTTAGVTATRTVGTGINHTGVRVREEIMGDRHPGAKTHPATAAKALGGITTQIIGATVIVAAMGNKARPRPAKETSVLPTFRTCSSRWQIPSYKKTEVRPS